MSERLLGSEALGQGYVAAVGHVDCDNGGFTPEQEDIIARLSHPDVDSSIQGLTVVDKIIARFKQPQSQLGRLGVFSIVSLGVIASACSPGGAGDGEGISPRSDALDLEGLAPTDIATGASEPTEAATEALSNQERAENFWRDLQAYMPDFDLEDEVSIGDDVDFENQAEERGDGAFTLDELGTLDSPEEIAQFFASDDERAVAVRENLEAKLADRPDLLKSALRGDNWVPVQILGEAVIHGTTYFVNGEIAEVTEGRAVGENDIFWFLVDEQGMIVHEIRADCGNPHLIIITKPPAKLPPSITITPPPATTPPATTPPVVVTPKIDDGVLPGNPEVPADQDPGTPDIPGKGPAEQPVDPNTGCVDGETGPACKKNEEDAEPDPTPSGEEKDPEPAPNPTVTEGDKQPEAEPAPVITEEPQATETVPPMPD